jgi:phosphoribosylaminoimidazolecarboxamide formyltransferase/IMP cyclohydrolase
MRELEQMGAVPIDLVVCNLYPFARRWAAGESRATLIEHIDVGGTTLLRAAAKNMDAGVLVVCDVDDYDALLDALRHRAHTPSALRGQLAAKAFRRVAEYDMAIASWCEAPQARAPQQTLPDVLGGFIKAQTLRYGDNPTQPAALYRVAGENGTACGVHLAGPNPTSATLLDVDAGCQMVHLAARPAISLIKHLGLCGLAQAQPNTPPHEVLQLALQTHPQACRGAIAACNTEVDAALIGLLVQRGIVLCAIAAPAFNPHAVQAAAALPELVLWQMPPGDPAPGLLAHRIGGGLLLQQAPKLHFDCPSFQQLSRLALTQAQQLDVALALQAVWIQKSSAVTLIKDGLLVGASGGHVSRSDALNDALAHASSRAQGAVLASDGPFGDARLMQQAIDAGIVGVVYPGGTQADSECAALCDAAEIGMYVTAQRLLRH